MSKTTPKWGATVKLYFRVSKTIKVKGKKYHYKEGKNEVYCDGKTIWNYQGEDGVNEVYVTDIDEADEENSLDPSKMFTIWEEGFKSKYAGENKIGTRTIQTIKLYPTAPSNKPVHTIVLNIDKVKKEITKIIIKGKDGINSTYSITKTLTNQAISETTFKFNKAKFPDVDIID